MSTLIYRVLVLVLRFNARLYGAGATTEVLRDLTGQFKGAV